MDLLYDAKKFKGNSELALGTKLNGDFYAIQAFPPLSDDKVVPVALDANVSGSYEFKLMAIENMDASVVVLLEDRALGIFHNFRLDSTYSFTTPAASDIDRFYLHFNPAVVPTSISESCEGGDGEIVLDQQGHKTWDYVLLDNLNNQVAAETAFNGIQTITDLQGGTYTLKLTDTSGYQVTKTITIDTKDQVEAGFMSSDSVTYENTPVDFTSISTGANDYEWHFGDGYTAVSTPNPTHIYTSEGLYDVTLKALNDDCQDEAYGSVEVLKTTTGGLDGQIEGNLLNIYSANNKIFLDFHFKSEEIAKVGIYDIVGKEVYQSEMPAQGFHIIDLHTASGLYMVRVLVGGSVVTHKAFNANE